MRKYGRVDAIQREVVDALRSVGASVEILSDVGNGVPDLLVGIFGRNLLMECKSEDGNLSPDQEEWIDSWKGSHPAVVRSAEDALRMIGARL